MGVSLLLATIRSIIKIGRSTLQRNLPAQCLIENNYFVTKKNTNKAKMNAISTPIVCSCSNDFSFDPGSRLPESIVVFIRDFFPIEEVCLPHRKTITQTTNMKATAKPLSDVDWYPIIPLEIYRLEIRFLLRLRQSRIVKHGCSTRLDDRNSEQCTQGRRHKIRTQIWSTHNRSPCHTPLTAWKGLRCRIGT